MTSSWQQEVDKRIRVSQITVGAMVAGSLVFLVVAMAVRGLHRPLRWEWTPMTLMLAGCAVAGVVAGLIVPAALVRRGCRAILDGRFPLAQTAASEHDATQASLGPMDEPYQLMLLFHMKTLMATALVEGVGCFAIATYMVEGSGFGLGLALLAVVAILLRMPTRAATIHWIEDQLHLMEQERAWERPGS